MCWAISLVDWLIMNSRASASHPASSVKFACLATAGTPKGELVSVSFTTVALIQSEFVALNTA